MYNPIFYQRNRFDLLSHGSFYLSRTPQIWSKSWGAQTIQCATWCRFFDEINKVKFLVINIHLDKYSPKSRLNTSKLLVKLINTQQLPVVLAGDFNTRPWVPLNEDKMEYPSLIIKDALPNDTETYNFFLDNEFLDTYIESGLSNIPNMNTYHDNHGANFPQVALRLDWILIHDRNKVLKPLYFKIIEENLDNIYPSDHYPVLTYLKVEHDGLRGR